MSNEFYMSVLQSAHGIIQNQIETIKHLLEQRKNLLAQQPQQPQQPQQQDTDNTNQVIAELDQLEHLLENALRNSVDGNFEHIKGMPNTDGEYRLRY